MKHLFCINPAAGKYDHTEQFRAAIEESFSGEEYGVFVSSAPGEITRVVKEAAATGDEYRVYACGGDGTLNEAVSGAVFCPNVAVTHWPGGSGNDFVRMFSRPERFLDLRELLDASVAEFDVISANDQYCVGVASVGLDARIGTEIARYKRLPLVTGSGAYILSTAVNFVKGLHRPYRVTVDGVVYDGEQTMICLCNGRWYGGGFNPVPEAVPDDGLMDVLLVGEVSRLKAGRLIGLYKAGRYAEIPDLVTHLRTRQVRVECAVPNAVNLDGQLMTADSVTFTLRERALRFFYPKGETWSPK